MYQSGGDKLYTLIIELVAKYLVWFIFGFILLLWFFYKDLIENFGNLILFWAPTLILICSLILVFIKINFKTSRDEDQGIYQYEISVTKIEFYLVDLIIYFGTLSILITSYFAKAKQVEIIDLIHALLFFILASALKQIFYKKIIK